MTKDLKKSKIKIEQEKEDKIIQAEGEEFLDQITQDNEEKAAKIIVEKGQEADKKSLEDKVLKTEELEQARKFARKEYLHKLANLTYEMAKYIDWPVGYTYYVGFNETKMNLIITTPDGRKFGRGIVASGVPTYDINAIGVLVEQCENTIDQLMNRGKFKKVDL